MTALFTVDFENNKLFDTAKGFDIVANWGGTIEVSTDSDYEGTYGCKFTVASSQTNQRACGMKKIPYVSRLRQSFRLHPNAITLANGQSIRIARNYHDDTTMVIYQIRLFYVTGSGYCIAIGIADNTGLITSNSGNTSLPTQNGFNLIETDWIAGSPGSFQLWINGTNITTLTATNNNLRINYPCIGTTWCSDTAASGSYFIDYWRANNDGTLIG